LLLSRIKGETLGKITPRGAGSGAETGRLEIVDVIWARESERWAWLRDERREVACVNRAYRVGGAEVMD